MAVDKSEHDNYNILKLDHGGNTLIIESSTLYPYTKNIVKFNIDAFSVCYFYYYSGRHSRSPAFLC